MSALGGLASGALANMFRMFDRNYGKNGAKKLAKQKRINAELQLQLNNLHKHIAIQDKQIDDGKKIIDNCTEEIMRQADEIMRQADEIARLLLLVAKSAEANNERAARAVLDRENPHEV
jgi:ribonuclease HII